MLLCDVRLFHTRLKTAVYQPVEAPLNITMKLVTDVNNAAKKKRKEEEQQEKT